MAPLGTHSRLRLLDNRIIAPTPAQQRQVVLTALEQGQRDDLLCVSLSGDHLHFDALCGEKAASRLVQRITSSVKQRLAIPQQFTHYPHEPIRDKRHLWYSVRYILTQQQRHGLPPEQALDGTNLPDLLGLRLTGAYTRENLRKWLPQLRQSHLMEWLGVDSLRLADGPPELVAEATLAAAGLDELRGSSARVNAARCALVEVAGARTRSAELAELLHVGIRSVQRLRKLPADAALVRAIHLQLGVRADLCVHGNALSTGTTG